jgi:hypothetical protein
MGWDSNWWVVTVLIIGAQLSLCYIYSNQIGTDRERGREGEPCSMLLRMSYLK